jgi:hypothetical protein
VKLKNVLNNTIQFSYLFTYIYSTAKRPIIKYIRVKEGNKTAIIVIIIILNNKYPKVEHCHTPDSMGKDEKESSKARATENLNDK